MSGKSWSVISPTVVIKHISIKAVQNLKKKKKYILAFKPPHGEDDNEWQ